MFNSTIMTPKVVYGVFSNVSYEMSNMTLDTIHKHISDAEIERSGRIDEKTVLPGCIMVKSLLIQEIEL